MTDLTAEDIIEALHYGNGLEEPGSLYIEGPLDSATIDGHTNLFDVATYLNRVARKETNND